MLFNLFYLIAVPLLLNKLENYLLPIETEQNINLEYYTGKWYQVGTSKSTQLMGTGVNYTNVTAEYNCIGDCQNNNITIFNEGYDENGSYKKINGYSYCNINDMASKRKLKFDNLPFIGNYWVIKLGPVIDDKYEYSIVSGSLSNYLGTRFSLYVLARDVNDFREKYEKQVIQWCENNGFVFPWNKYVQTN